MTRRTKVLLVIGAIAAVLVLLLAVSFSFNEGGIEVEYGENPSPMAPPTTTGG